MDATENEARLYGQTWEQIHGGYFSDPGVAAPLVDELAAAIADSRPAVVADLGGGTGFLLDRLHRREEARGVELVNVDSAGDQLHESRPRHMRALRCDIDAVQRAQLTGDGPLLMCMRSVLHYFGSDRLTPLLRHLRSVARTGELLVHQTACFGEAGDRDILNLLYERIGTSKWYPTLVELEHSLAASGWEVQRAAPFPALPLESGELCLRYEVDAERMAQIAGELFERFGEVPGVLEREAAGEGFVAFLHYCIMRCRAKAPRQ